MKPPAVDELLHRSVDAALVELSDDRDDQPWQVRARLVPYGVEAELGQGVTEVFELGAFRGATDVPQRVKMRGVGVADGHKDAPIIGHATELRESPAGLDGVFVVPRTQVAADTITLLRSGTLDEMSVEFEAKRDGMRVERRGQGVHVTHHKARLRAVAPVPAGAYGRDALVTSVRSLADAERDAVLARLRALRAGER